MPEIATPGVGSGKPPGNLSKRRLTGPFGMAAARGRRGTLLKAATMAFAAAYAVFYYANTCPSLILAHKSILKTCAYAYRPD
jgi:hypothetical protein